jgi:hypothetical protein
LAFPHCGQTIPRGFTFSDCPHSSQKSTPGRFSKPHTRQVSPGTDSTRACPHSSQKVTPSRFSNPHFGQTPPCILFSRVSPHSSQKVTPDRFSNPHFVHLIDRSLPLGTTLSPSLLRMLRPEEIQVLVAEKHRIHRSPKRTRQEIQPTRPLAESAPEL